MSRTRDEGMRARILEAAIAVFGEKGFQETTLKDIGAGAGISTGSVYTYFDDKESLFEASAAWGWERFNADLEELATSSQSLDDRLASLLGSGLLALKEALPLLRGMLFDASRRNLVQPGLERVIDSIDRILDPYFEGGRSQSEEGAHMTRRALIRIFVTGILFSAAFGGSEKSDEELAGLRTGMLAFFSMLGDKAKDGA